MRMAGNVARFVAGEKERHPGYFLGRAEPAHWLARDEILPHGIERTSGLLRHRRDAFAERRRLDRARTNGVAADALLDEIGGDRLGEPDHRGLGGAVDI